MAPEQVSTSTPQQSVTTTASNGGFAAAARESISSMIGKRRSTRSTNVRARQVLTQPRSCLWRNWRAVRLLKLNDLLFSVELTSMWRRHLLWSRKGQAGSKELIDIVTGRFASTQIFLSLLFASEVGTYYSPSKIVTDVRDSLRTGPFANPLEYATGIVLIVSIILTGAAVLANYTALGVFKCIGQDNAVVILRSDIGLYAATLPSRLTFVSIMTFLAWNVMFWWINVDDAYDLGAIILTVFFIVCIAHVVATFSALARVIMITSAMGYTAILPRGDEEKMLPHELSNVLLTESNFAKRLHTPVNQQYRNNTPVDQTNNEEPLTYETSLRRRYPEIELDDVV